MTTRRTVVVAKEMARTRGCLDRWRKTRPVGVAMPEKLWAAAVKLGRRHGVYRTARALGLEYNKLKRLSQHANHTETATPPPRFVEVSVPPPTAVAGCRIELTGPRGGNLKIELAAPPSTSLLVELCRAAWGDAG
jgi:hypothetical protein